MILTVNAGSSSLKVSLYQRRPDLAPRVTASIDRLDGGGGRWTIRETDRSPREEEAARLTNHADALARFLEWLDQRGYRDRIVAAGHRIVHGGSTYTAPVAIDDDVIDVLTRLIPLDRGHLPQAIAAIGAVSDGLPDLPQMACFDTAFHRSMPRVARQVPLPRRLEGEGVTRYGFHGLSYEYIQGALDALDPESRTRRTVIAHLGNGASMVAVRDGRSIDTTMGMTPTGGLMMGTRSGDLDPGTLVYLMRTIGLDAAALDALVNRESGLLGVSGISGDLRDVREAAANHAYAREALDLFCYQAKKHLGALTAVLGGLDRLVFTGGIGEHAATIRHDICADLGFLGIHLDDARNASHGPVISRDGGAVEVRVMPTNEDMMIARHVERMLRAGNPRLESPEGDMDATGS